MVLRGGRRYDSVVFRLPWCVVLSVPVTSRISIDTTEPIDLVSYI